MCIDFIHSQLYTKIGVRISLVGVEIWSQKDMIHVTPNAEILLYNFQDYLQYRTQYFDGALLITLVLVPLIMNCMLHSITCI